ncbi:unnamed protein product [Anisakis simplex]|uniref:Sphingomyelin phosphodiesterase 4 n=1 Tax=Anisakis simplex TaxID=6269 RepID=A0A0M3JUP6_ANISI|nr:unnamed protein product [Anisakis simplex]
MDFYGSSPSALSLTCNELRDKIVNGAWPGDSIDFALIIVERLFNNPQIDLLSVLPSSSYDLSGIEYDQIIDLIGTSSSAFKALIESDGDQNFDFFIGSFCAHLERSTCDLPVHLVENSVYMYLLADYVCFMMPIETTAGSRADVSTKNLKSSNISISSPLRLFEEDALQRYSLSPARNSLKTLHSFSQSLSPHFVSFICTVIKSLCSLSSWPSEYRLSALRYVLKQYHVFVLALTDDGILLQVKSQLLHNPPFVDQLYDFLDSMLAKWPDNVKFIAVFEVWMTWIRPWRYSQEGDDDCSSQRIQLFIESNRRFYVQLTDAFFRRVVYLDNPSSVLTLRNYLLVILSEQLQKTYKWLRYDLETPIVKLGAVVAKWADYIRRLVAEERECVENESWLGHFVSSSGNENRYQKLSVTLNELDELTNSIADAASTTVSALLNEKACVPPYITSESPRLSSSPWNKPLPDHYVNPSTKLMHLTNLGRQQVRRGTHRFDLSRCCEYIPPLLAPQRSDEVWWLAKLLYRLSCFLNRTAVIKYLSMNYNECSLIGMLSRAVLDPEYPRVVVPSFTKTTFAMKPAMNLRRFAQYKYFLPVCIFVLLAFLMPFYVTLPMLFVFVVLSSVSQF